MWFQINTADKEKEIADLRSELETASQAVSNYPDAVTALKAIRAELSTAEAAYKKAKAETDALDMRQKDRAANLATVEKQISEQTAALTQSQKSLQTELADLQAKKDELTGSIQDLSNNLQAALELLKGQIVK